LELQTHKAHQTRQSGKYKEAVTLGTAKPPHTKQTHKGKSIALAKLKAKRQRFKKLFRLELQRHTPSKPTKEIYCTPTKQNGKYKEAVTLGTAKPPHTKQTHKGKSIVHQTGKAAKDKEAVTLF